MLKKQLAFSVVYLAPAVAFAGDGGGYSDNGALLIQAVGRLIGKLTGIF